MIQNFIPASSWRPLNRNTDLWNVFVVQTLTTLSKITPQTKEREKKRNCKSFVKDIMALVHQETSLQGLTFTNAPKHPPNNEYKHGLKSTCWLFCDRGYEILNMISILRIVSVCSSDYLVFLHSDDLSDLSVFLVPFLPCSTRKYNKRKSTYANFLILQMGLFIAIFFKM